MNNKIFLKIGWLFIISLLAYLFFVVFFLSPKVNSYLTDTEMENSKIQFNKVVSIINNKSRVIENKDDLKKEIELLLTSFTLGKSGHIYIWISSLIALIPIIFFFLALAVFRLKGSVAGTITVVLALLVPLFCRLIALPPKVTLAMLTFPEPARDLFHVPVVTPSVRVSA